jgi:tripeptidyl-peptidase I
MGFSVMNKICLAAIYVCVSIELVAHAVPQHSVGQLINADVKATHVLKEMAVSRSDIVRGDRALSSQIHDVIFVVKRLNVDKMELNLQEISDHTNPKYGHHLTKKMIDEITSNPTSRRHVMDHLTAIGATIISDTPYGDHHITARATVGLWEELFQTEFHSYTHASEKRNLKVLRARKYSIPLSLDAHVSSVYNTVQAPFSKSRRPSAKSANPSLSDITSRKLTFLHPHTTTPQLLYNAYGVRDTTGHPLATQAIYSMYDQYYSPEDIASWQYFMNITMIPVARTIGVGTTSPATCALEVELCAEGNADLSYIMAMCSSPTTFYGSDTVSMALWLERVYQDGDPPLVISISYGADEVLVSDQEQRDFSQAALLLGNMGVTIVVSSGDDGVHSSNARNNYSSCGYMPGFPATSPYVVSVGATQV